MSEPLPENFPAGWQAVEAGAVREGDILVSNRGDLEWATTAVGMPVSHFTDRRFYRSVYRRMACPKQGDFDAPPSDLVHRTQPAAIPTDAAERKKLPVCTGVLDYFPDALLAVAACSKKGNDQHNPGKPLHWDRSKSQDEADALVRHLLSRGTLDTDGIRHSAKVAWRALALLQKEIEAEKR
jgi:hypothetical protein